MKAQIMILFLFISILRLHAADTKFHRINSIYGISVREIYSVCQDKNGFIWASSKAGILRITEDDYRIYPIPYKTADIISTQLVYSDSLLIAYTNNGQMFLYDELYDRFDFFLDLRIPFDFAYMGVDMMLIDNEQTIWIPTVNGLCRYKNGETLIMGKNTLEVLAIEHYDENHLFLATREGIDVLDIHTLERETVYQHASTHKTSITALFYDKKTNRLWAGSSSDGFFYYDLNEKPYKEIQVGGFPKQPILAIEENGDTSLLVGIDGQGVWELSRNGDSILNVYKEDVDNPFSLPGNGVHDIFCDDGKKVWVATFSGGLSFYELESQLVEQITHSVNNPNSLGNNDVNKIIEDRKGNIWFATNNGISRWKVATNQWDTYYQNKQEQAQVFLTLCEDGEGNIWAGSYSSGFYILDGDTGKELAHYYQKNGSELSGKFIYDIYRDSEGDIWVGGLQDVICYYAKEKKFRTYPSQSVRSFMELSPGKMLIACTHGLILLDKQTENIDYFGTFLAQDIVIADSIIWIGTSGDGLVSCNLRDRVSTRYQTESGLPSNFVNSVMSINGYLWLGTENGLCRFNPTDRTGHIYSSNIALSSVSFNVNSDLMLRNGNLIWGTNKGAIMFDPNMLYYSRLNGRIFYQDIFISGRSIRENPDLLLETPVDKQTKISLAYNQNNLSLELLPLGMSSGEAKFSWKMERLDADWSQPSNLQVPTYTNLPTGNFQLKMRLYDSSLSQVIDERILDIHITPPYWDTWWFRLIVFIILASVAYFSMKFYISRLKQRHAEDKIRFFTNTAHDLRTSLTLINAPIEELNKETNLSDKGRYYLDLATEQSGRLSFVATQLLDFQKVDVGKGQLFLVMVDIVNLVRRRKIIFEASAERKNIRLEFTSNQDSFMTAVDELKMEKVVDNLISNAIKYSHPDSKVEIKLMCSAHEWVLEVKDYGLGISEHAQKKLFREFYRGDNVVNSKMVGSGIGLLLVKNYVTMHQGYVSVDSKENEGASFRIAIPHKEVNEIMPWAVDDNSAIFIAKDHQLNNPSIDASTENKTSVLIVEDNTDLQNFLKSSFQDQYKISLAADGSEAWDLIQKEAPDLIISDIMMPNMDGFELCRLVKSTFETAHIPVILLTALSAKTNQLEGLGLGADDYITKPFDTTILSQRISSIIRNRETVRARVLKQANHIEDQRPILTNEFNDKFVKKALEVIMHNMDNTEFGKDEFASSMNVSTSLLYKKIKTLTGQSPVDFIKIVRLNHAFELLHTHKNTITEVSELCGFSSLSYFSTVFKKHFGKSPTEI